MELTSTGLVLIPLTLVALMMPNIWTLAWVIFVSVFEAAAIVNFGGPEGYGLQPGYFAAILFIGKIATLAMWNGAFLYNKQLLFLALPLAGFCLWAVFSAFTIPNILTGLIEVYSPRDGLSLGSLSPLKPRSTNITQPVYALLVCVFWFLASNVIANAKEVTPVVTAFIASGILVVAVGYYELVSHYTGLRFPESFFHNSAGRSLVHVQTMFGIRRIASTFPEPSRFAAWMAGYLPFITIYYMNVAKSPRYLVLSIAALIAFMLSTSTTAYAIVAIFMVWTGAKLWPRNLMISTRIPTTHFLWWTTLISITSAAIALFIASGLGQVVTGVMQSSIVGKLATTSALSRFAADYQALLVFLKTGGIGVGWGSFRSSSLLTTILASGGLIGCGFLTWFMVKLKKMHRRVTTSEIALLSHFPTISSFTFAVVGVCLAALISSPDFATIAIWINLSLLTGLLLRNIRLEPDEVVDV